MPKFSFLRHRRSTTLILLLVAVWLVFSQVALPLLERMRELEQRAAITQKKLDRLHQLARRKPAIEDAVQRYRAAWSDEPDAAIQRALLDQLEGLAQAGNVQISLKPQPMKQEHHVLRVEVELELDATQEAIFEFVDRLLAAPSLLELTRVRISSTTSKTAPVRAILLVSQLVLRS